MKTVCLTGSQGFIGGYLCRHLLELGYRVVGIDNYSKYGVVTRDYDDHPNFVFINLDLSTSGAKLTLARVLNSYDVDYLIAGAAMIGGISYFHKYAYDLLATNERIIANTFDAAIEEMKSYEGRLKRIVVISSSMVYEGVDTAYEYGRDPAGLWPSGENEVKSLPPPLSTYGFQKLSCEYFAKGAWEQHRLPYTIVRPFNCVGIGEEGSIQESEVSSGNIKLTMSHVLPDLALKVVSGQNPLRILGNGSQIRCYTHGKDIARGIVMAMESEKAENEAFNISSSRQTTVLELARMVWDQYHRGHPEFTWASDEPFKYDVQKRIPDVSKAKEILGFETFICLEESVAEVLGHVQLMKAGRV